MLNMKIKLIHQFLHMEAYYFNLADKCDGMFTLECISFGISIINRLKINNVIF